MFNKSDTLLERLAALERENPEWQSWTAMLRVLERAIGDPVWRDPVCDPTHAGHGRPGLDAQSLHVPGQAMCGLIRSLLNIALSTTSRSAANELDADRMLALLHASITRDADAIDVAAQMLGMRTAALATVLNTATIPLLNACATQLEPGIAGHWPQGYCPVCGERPALVELLGLDRSRRLRCGRCGTGWDMPWLVCGFCQEADHARLGTLVPGTGSGSHRHRIETCSTCRGYLKTIDVLTAGSLVDLLLADVESVALDVAAQRAGFVRPGGGGHPISVRLFYKGPLQ